VNYTAQIRRRRVSSPQHKIFIFILLFLFAFMREKIMLQTWVLCYTDASALKRH